MRRFIKIFMALFISYALVSILTGSLLRKNIETTIPALNHNKQLLTLVYYDQGWFSSKLILEVYSNTLPTNFQSNLIQSSNGYAYYHTYEHEFLELTYFNNPLLLFKLASGWEPFSKSAKII